MASISTYHPALYPCHAASGLHQVPESIVHKGPEIWLYDCNRGVRRVLVVVAAGPLEVSAPSGLHGSCVCDHRNQSRVGDVMRAEWLTKC
jgi:hypothetical protein